VTKTNLVIVQKVPNGTRGKLKLYLNPANTSSKQGNVGVARQFPATAVMRATSEQAQKTLSNMP
jgi:hypothetical protein